MSLDDALKAAAKRGQLNHISLTAHAARGGAITFRAAYRNTSGDGHKHAEDADPAVALHKVLK